MSVTRLFLHSLYLYCDISSRMPECHFNNNETFSHVDEQVKILFLEINLE